MILTGLDKNCIDICLKVTKQISDIIYKNNFLLLNDDLSLAQGYSSLVVFYSALEKIFGDQEFKLIKHTCILKIKELLESKGIEDSSIWSGLSGVCLAINLAGEKENAYQKIQKTLDNLLIQKLKNNYFPILQNNILLGKPSSVHLYDAIQGISGIGVYFLKCLQKENFKEILCEILSILVSFCSPIEINGKTVPGWYRQPLDEFLIKDRQRFIHGSFNLGLSHGVTGVLALLSLSYLNKIIVKDQKNAIAFITEWLWNNKSEGDKGIYWIDRIPYEKQINPNLDVKGYSKDAWCYGAPGISRTIFIASKALKNNQMIKNSSQAFSDIFLRNKFDWNISDSSFCHGLSGLLTITNKMSKDIDLPLFKEKKIFLKNEILNSYNEKNYLGFFSFEDGQALVSDSHKKLGLLEGAPGIILSLLSAELSMTTKWDQAFLIG